VFHGLNTNSVLRSKEGAAPVLWGTPYGSGPLLHLRAHARRNRTELADGFARGTLHLANFGYGLAAPATERGQTTRLSSPPRGPGEARAAEVRARYRPKNAARTLRTFFSTSTRMENRGKVIRYIKGV
jgi:hypothetical protein